MTPFRKNQRLLLNGVEMEVVRYVDQTDVVLENIKTGGMSSLKLADLIKSYADGTLLTVVNFRASVPRRGKKHKGPARMDKMSPRARRETMRRLDYLTRLANQRSFDKCREALKADIRAISEAKGEIHPPHVTTIYRWRRTYLQAQQDVRALFCAFEHRGGKGRPRLGSEVEAIIHDKVETIYMAQKTSAAAEIHRAVFLEITMRNTQRVESEWLAVPSLRTIERRISELYGYDRCVARYGEREAERRYGNYIGARPVTRILEIVEIDHTPVDLLVTNDEGVVIGRPTITVVLDRRSRCVLGYHLSLAGHGTSAVFSAIRHALLPKTYLRDRYADLKLEWDCYGWPELVLMDNGGEFHAEAVADALMNLAINAEFARSLTPNDKPYVERFLKTFNYDFIHRQPGTTLAKVHHRIGFKAEDDACMTLEQLDRIIHVWICEVYHQKPHRGLNKRTPMAVWQEGAAQCPPQLKANKQDVDIEFSQLCSSSLQHYGIDLNTFVYVSPRLLLLRRKLPLNARVDVKWPDHDAGCVFVWDPLEKEYFKVANKDADYSGLTVEQAKLAKKARAAAEPSSPIAAARGEAVIRQITQQAMSDKKLKHRRRGARMANKTSEDSRGTRDQHEAVDLASAASEAVTEEHDSPEAVPVVEIDLDWGGTNA